ncbi:hypothetical protein H1R20_g13296, partial [Candolleomyces eurysporus]
MFSFLKSNPFVVDSPLKLAIAKFTFRSLSPTRLSAFHYTLACLLSSKEHDLRIIGLQLTALLFKHQRLESDRSIYLYVKGELQMTVPIYIDDITLAYQDNHSISLSQCQYIIDMLERYGMQDCNPVTTPLVPGIKLSKSMGPQNGEKVKYMRSVPYLNAIGTLQYLCTMTWPNIVKAVSFLGCFSQNPSPQHWNTVKRLFQYLQGTKDYKLTYTKGEDGLAFTTYCDASHSDCINTRCSTGAYITCMGAEYMAAVEAGKEILWMRNILSKFGYPFQGPSLLWIDNQSAISVSKNPEHFGQMKHLDLQFYWLRDVMDDGCIDVLYIPGTQQPVDGLTKALSGLEMKLVWEQMGLKLS